MKLKDLSKALIVKPGTRVRLADMDPGDTAGIKDKEEARDVLERNRLRLQDLHTLLYAENRRALLIVLQGMDASGKDGTIRHVMSGVNPQGCEVTSFKVPSAEELDHDFLWRIHKAVPPKGDIGIFNRSHYEEVLVVRVHRLVPREVWSGRYEQINRFEQILSENNLKILKFFLHISKDEQKKRLRERLADPTKNWKMSLQDLKERELWGDYMKAYEDALTECSTTCAPWFVIPADNKWFRNLSVSEIIIEALESFDMKYPKLSFDPRKVVVK
ncbi:MAG TPA: polyphosphate kinase 2 family protein [Terriglobales bacterium]|nr:polyphosphate kinase 2 family protein [Terriglobales bacterium]